MRIVAYRNLWAFTEPLALYSPPKPAITYYDLSEMSSKMREWYFRTGGWILSEDCRNSYFDFQKTIMGVLGEKPS